MHCMYYLYCMHACTQCNAMHQWTPASCLITCNLLCCQLHWIAKSSEHRNFA